MSENQNRASEATEEAQTGRETADGTGASDATQVVLRAEDGTITHAEGVKGPDPDVWGADEERPDPFAAQADEGVPLDTVTDDGVKGPASEYWEQDEDGNYVNR